MMNDNLNLRLYLASAFKNENEINALITMGANPDYLSANDYPLHNAINHNQFPIPVIRALLLHGANPNLKDPLTGETSLHLAVRMGFVEIVVLLMEKNADETIENNQFQTPLQLANIGLAVIINKFAIYRQASQKKSA